jgi:hypothetical protein
MTNKNTPENPGRDSGAAPEEAARPVANPFQTTSSEKPEPADDVPEVGDRRQNTVDRRQFERVVKSPVSRREAD